MNNHTRKVDFLKTKLIDGNEILMNLNDNIYIPMLTRAANNLRFLYGGLKDSDRIFTNVYRDGDPFINGALKRVKLYSDLG